MKASTLTPLGIAIMVFILVGGSILLPATVVARGAKDSPENVSETPDVLPSVNVTIEKKSRKTVTTKFGDVYALTDETIVVAKDGTQIDIRELPVLCKAEIVFVHEGKARKALSVRVKSVHPNAHTNATGNAAE